MRTAVALMALMNGSDTVYVSRRGRRFHEDPECRALGAGHMIFACRCGDPYCGCAADKPPVPEEVSINGAAVRDLDPCAVCYPGFDGLAVQLASDNDFGHQAFDEYGHEMKNAYRLVCRRCVTWHVVGVESDKWLIGQRVAWPCTSAVVLGLAPRQEESIG